MKKYTIITAILVILALSAAVFAGCGNKEAQNQVPASTKNANRQQQPSTTKPQESEAQTDQNLPINVEDIESGDSGMTFEEFLIGMKEDLSPEVMEELKEIYEEWVQAEKEGDTEKIAELYEIIQGMGVLTMEEQEPMYKIG